MTVSFASGYSYNAFSQFNKTQPRFAAKKDGSLKRGKPSQQMEVESQEPPKSKSVAGKVCKYLGGTVLVTTIVGAVTSPLWAPITGVGVACNKNAPEGAIAKIHPIAGLGPSKGMCPSAFVTADGDIWGNDAPSWQTFHVRGHADENGLVTSNDDVVGKLIGDKFYTGPLVTHQPLTVQDPSHGPSFDEQAKAGRVKPKKVVKEDGTVQQAKKWGYVTLTEAKVDLIGDAKGKKLTELPEDQQTKIKAAAAANGGLWAIN